MTRKKVLMLLGSICLALTLVVPFVAACAAPAEKFPSRSFTLTVGWGAGGDSDAYGRTTAMGFEERFGVPVNVVNIQGNSTTLALTQVMRSLPPDGYTMHQLESSACVPHVQGTDVPDVRNPEEVRSLGSLELTGAAIVTLWDSKYKTIQDVIDDIKARPGEIKIAIAGWGGASGIATHIFKAESGLPFEVVSVGSGVEVLKGLLSGDLDIVMQTYAQWPPYLGEDVPSDKRVRILLFLDKERFPLHPDVPTGVELGYTNAYYVNYYGMVIRPDTPEDIAETLLTTYTEMLQDPEFINKMEEIGFIATKYRTPEETYELARSYHDRVQKLVETGVLK